MPAVYFPKSPLPGPHQRVPQASPLALAASMWPWLQALPHLVLETIGGSAESSDWKWDRSEKDGLEELFWKTVALGTATQPRVGGHWWRFYPLGPGSSWIYR